jgi:tRNA(Ile2) C34 agmatinyltransferase TiaS
LTVGEVSSVRGNTLYVANSQGNTIKVTAPAGVKVTKTVSTKAKSIHPGDTVTVVGSQGKNGSVNASSISVSSSTSSATGTTSPTGSGASGGGASALFGSG